MLFKQASAGDERVFVTVKNLDAASITTGNAVMLAIGTGASFDGIQAVNAISTGAQSLYGFLGIAVKDIAVNAFGLVQTYGNCLSVLISQMYTSITIGAGNPLTPSSLIGALSSVTGAATMAASAFGFIIASNPPTNTLSQAGPLYASGFIRCIK
jgi:hypothetical protein